MNLILNFYRWMHEAHSRHFGGLGLVLELGSVGHMGQGWGLHPIILIPPGVFRFDVVHRKSLAGAARGVRFRRMHDIPMNQNKRAFGYLQRNRFGDTVFGLENSWYEGGPVAGRSSNKSTSRRFEMRARPSPKTAVCLVSILQGNPEANARKWVSGKESIVLVFGNGSPNVRVLEYVHRLDALRFPVPQLC